MVEILSRMPIKPIFRCKTVRKTWNEEVKSLPTPPGLKSKSFGLTLVELGNCLCFSEDSSTSQYVDLWRMKEYGLAELWTKDRLLIDYTHLDPGYRKFTPILTWKDGEILIQGHQGTQLNSYNPKENKLRKVNVYGNGIASALARYTSSFRSLKFMWKPLRGKYG
ncbi:hypothetical protein P3S68_032962 [Capsicum galapagoense]